MRTKEDRQRAALINPWWKDPERLAKRREKLLANPNWQASVEKQRKGGKIRADGRVDVYWRGRYRPRARVVMEKHLGRELLPTEHVHHINEDPTDDRVENLMVLSQSEHMALHEQLRRERGITNRGSICAPGCTCSRHRTRPMPSRQTLRAVAARRASGEKLTHLAREVGVSNATLLRWLAKV